MKINRTNPVPRASEPVGDRADPPTSDRQMHLPDGQDDRHSTRFDGVICFGGEDWWYHNRGHYDLQMMRELSKRVPVLYVNSVGMRMPGPGEGRMFLRRMIRKIGSLRRGYVRLRSRFAVFSPIAAPGRLGFLLAERCLAGQVRRAAAKMNIHRPLVWIACPPGAVAIDALEPTGVVYQRTDRHECYAPEAHDQIARFDRWLKARADVTVFCSHQLHEEEEAQCRDACLIDHGVDYEQFARAGSAEHEPPEDMRGLVRPCIGFIGGIDRHTFDHEFMLEVASRLPAMQFVLIGACSLPSDWCRLDNVTSLGRKPYEDVARYMAACDVLIMPWRKNRWIEACNPVKLKEYLAVGRPVVSTYFPELDSYEGLLNIADTPEEFATAIRQAVATSHDPEAGRLRVRQDTWACRADVLLERLAGLGIHSEGDGPLPRRAAPSSTKESRVLVTTPPARFDDEPEESSDVLAYIGGSHPVVRLRTEVETRLTLAGDHEDVTPRPVDDRLAACLILDGGLKPSELCRQSGFSVLDLPLSSTKTVFETWVGSLRALQVTSPIPIRVIHDGTWHDSSHGSELDGAISFERQHSAYRGPAGVVSDACDRYDPAEHVLIVEGSRYAADGVGHLLDQHFARGAQVTVARNPDGSPGGMYVAECAACRMVPDRGFVDLKEQWLNRLSRNGLRIDVCDLPAPGSLPIRTLGQLLDAARTLSHQESGGRAGASPARGLIRDRSAQGLRVVCPGALIGPEAMVIDSIVMRGAVVPSNALIIRSLICPNGPIQTGADIVDSVIGVPDRPSNRVREGEENDSGSLKRDEFRKQVCR